MADLNIADKHIGQAIVYHSFPKIKIKGLLNDL